MTDARDLVGLLIDAIDAHAARGASGPVAIVSATFDWVAAPAAGEALEAAASTTRATRTIIFSRGDLRGADGRLLLTASAVHRVVAV